jgi:catechol 2,3-dioxygenase-like lactoylglutathione lyase family enzyme
MNDNIRLGSVSLDCADPRSLARFWAALLGGEIAYESDAFVAVQLGPVWMTAVAVEHYVAPTWPGDESPKQIHLDLAVRDLSAAATQALALGAVRCETQPDPDSYVVFVDPAGHPFCLTTQIPD